MAEGALLSSSEEVREREPAREEAPSPLTKVAAAAYPDWKAETLPKFLESRERLARGKEATAEAVRPYVTSAEEAVRARDALPTSATPPNLRPSPPKTPADFLSVSPGQSPESAINNMVNALGLFAQMGGALARKHATSGLAAWTGALSGWKLGATEKANAQFDQWKADTDTAISEWTNTRTAIQDALKASDKTIEERFRLAEMKAWEAGLKDAAEALRSGTMEKYIDIQQKADDAAAKLMQSAATLAETKRMHDITEEHYKREDARRDRETRIKEQESGSGGGLSDAALTTLADRYRKGEPLRDLVRGFGRRATNIVLEIQNRAEQQALAAGDAPGAIRMRAAHLAANRSSLTDLSKKEAEFNSFLSSFEKQLKQTKRLFDEAKTSGSPVWNKPTLWYRASVEGDTTAKNLLSQMEIMANEMSRITLRTRGTAEGTRQHHRELLNGSMTVEQFVSLADQVMDFDAQAARQGFAEEKARLSQAIGGAETSAPTTTTPQRGPAVLNGQTLRAAEQNGVRRMIPSDTDLSKYPGAKWLN